MSSLEAILEKHGRLKAKNAAIFGPLLHLSPEELNAAPVSTSGLTRSDIQEKIRKIYQCANLLEFRPVYTTGADGVMEQRMKLHNATFCKAYTVCEICARRVQLSRWKRFREPIDNLVGKHPYVYHLTLTIEDRADLRERIDTLGTFFRAFVRAGQKRKAGRSLGEWGKVRAAIVGTESKRGENSMLWHSHKHALIFLDERLDFRVYDQDKMRGLVRKYGRGRIPKSELDKAALMTVEKDGRRVAVSKLSAEWLSATQGQGISIHARRLRGNVREVAKEVLKYPVKTSLRDKSDIPEIIDATYGRRMLSTHGELRGLEKDEYVDEETKKAREIWMAQWDRSKGEYGPLVSSRRPLCLIPDHVRAALWGKLGRTVGAYRKHRNQFRRAWYAAGGRVLASLSADLDAMRDAFRAEIGEIWRHYSLMPDTGRYKMPPPFVEAEQLSLAL